jgi:hypothetical protein
LATSRYQRDLFHLSIENNVELDFSAAVHTINGSAMSRVSQLCFGSFVTARSNRISREGIIMSYVNYRWLQLVGVSSLIFIVHLSSAFEAVNDPPTDCRRNPPLSKMFMMNAFPGLSFGVARVLLRASLARNEFTKLQN